MCCNYYHLPTYVSDDNCNTYIYNLQNIYKEW